MTWIVRKYIAYLVFDDNEGDNNWTYAFEPNKNKVMPAIFESHKSCKLPYKEALKTAHELNAANKALKPTAK